MSSTTKTTYDRTWTCDRCKVQFRRDVEGSPEGWEYLINDENEKFDLCPACCVSFGHWMSNPASLNIHIDSAKLKEQMSKAECCTCPKVKPFDPGYRLQTSSCLGGTFKPCKIHRTMVTY